MPQPGALVELEIHDLGSRGQGIGRSDDGLVVMVPGAVPGDRVQARLERILPNRAEAVLTRVLQPSPDRVEPLCRHFGTCGGCSLQSLRPAAQRALKARRVAELLRRTGGLRDVPVDAALEVGPAFGYRSRMSFAAGPGPRLGLHDRQGRLLEIQECHLPHAHVVDVLARVRQALAEAVHEDPGAGHGLLRLDIRRSRAQERLLATLDWEGPTPAAVRQRLQALADSGPGLRIVVQSAGLRPWVAGAGPLREELAGVPAPMTAGAFIQTHAEGAEALYAHALDWLRPAADLGALLDLYAGIGVLARAATPPFRQVVAVESAAASVRLGAAEAAAAALPVRFLQGEAVQQAEALERGGRRFAAAVANPPRSGMHRRLPRLLAGLGIRRLAYISCDPATLARDLGRLAAVGLRPVRVVPFDIFPQTSEIEVLALVEAESAPAVDGGAPGR